MTNGQRTDIDGIFTSQTSGKSKAPAARRTPMKENMVIRKNRDDSRPHEIGRAWSILEQRFLAVSIDSLEEGRVTNVITRCIFEVVGTASQDEARRRLPKDSRGGRITRIGPWFPTTLSRPNDTAEMRTSSTHSGDWGSIQVGICWEYVLTRLNFYHEKASGNRKEIGEQFSVTFPSRA